MFVSAQVNLYCDSVEECAAFYRGLGLGERFRTPVEGVPVMVEVAGPGLTVGLASAAVGNQYDLDVVPGRRSSELVFWCDDVAAAYDVAASAGGVEVQAPVDSPDGRLRFAWVGDPAGHLVKLVQRLDR